METIDLEEEEVRLERIMEESGIMLKDTALLDDERKKRFLNKK